MKQAGYLVVGKRFSNIGVDIRPPESGRGKSELFVYMLVYVE